MEIKILINILINIALLLFVLYLIFFKSWLKSLGKEIAKLSNAENLTTIKEEVKNRFNESIEEYKISLREELSNKIEPLKSNLAKNNIAFQIQYSYLHQERANVTIELYRKLQELHSAMVSWTALIQPVIENAEKEENQRRERANLAIKDFQKCYTTNKLFYNKSLCEYIDSTFNVYWEKGYEFEMKQSKIKNQLSQSNSDIYSKEITKISEEIRNVLPEKINEIEKQFRMILDINED